MAIITHGAAGGGAATPAVVAFKAYDSAGNDVTITNDILPCNAVHFNVGSHYDAGTYKFTAPIAGLYEFGWNAWDTNPAVTGKTISLMVDTETTLTGSINPTASTTAIGSGTLFLAEVTVGDTILVSGESRTVASITSNTELAVSVAFTDTADDTSPEATNHAAIIRPGSLASGECFRSILILSVGQKVYLSSKGYSINYYAGVTWNEFYGRYIGPAS